MSTSNDIPIINLEIFNDLASILEEDFYELLEDFIRDTPLQLSLLDTAVEEYNFKKIFEICHSQSGASGNLGLTKFHSMCDDISIHSNNESIENCIQLSKLLHKNFDECKVLLTEKIKNHK